MKVHVLPDDYSGDPQAVAMLQAFYSRSSQGIVERLDGLGFDLEKVKAALKSYYVNYGHDSIAGCGSVTLFIEGVSFLAAKVIQNNPLYNGQECSSRYLDFSTTNFYTPQNTSNNGRALQSYWLNLYNKILPLVNAGIDRKYPDTLKANKAFAFDICRGFLPAGMLTNLSLHVTLRNLNEQVAQWLVHPLEEVRAIGQEIYSTILSTKYESSNSVARQSVTPNIEYHYDCFTDGVPVNRGHKFIDLGFSHNKPCKSYLAERPKYQKVPQHFAKTGLFDFTYLIDYGSYRDIQRHRAGLQSFPLLTSRFGLESWYMQAAIRFLGVGEVDEFVTTFSKLHRLTASAEDNSDPLVMQYAIPLGYKVPFCATWDIGQCIYVAELRTGLTVHATARKFANFLTEIISKAGVNHHAVEDHEFLIPNYKRGNQDIVKTT